MILGGSVKMEMNVYECIVWCAMFICFTYIITCVYGDK
jgi:hypothetical protein